MSSSSITIVYDDVAVAVKKSRCHPSHVFCVVALAVAVGLRSQPSSSSSAASSALSRKLHEEARTAYPKVPVNSSARPDSETNINKMGRIVRRMRRKNEEKVKEEDETNGDHEASVWRGRAGGGEEAEAMTGGKEAMWGQAKIEAKLDEGDIQPRNARPSSQIIWGNGGRRERNFRRGGYGLRQSKMRTRRIWAGRKR